MIWRGIIGLPGFSRAAVLLFLTSPAGASAQYPEFDWSTEAGMVGANALLGGVGAGLAALIRGEPFAAGFASGAGGGVLVYAGKRIATHPRPGSGVVGRQVASVGSSIIGNVIAGRGALDRIALAAGPVRLYAGRAVPGVQWRLDLPALGSAAWGLLEGGELDLDASLSMGAIVVKGHGGFALPGTIFYNPAAIPESRAYILAHEQVHVLQYDQSFLSWGEPLEGWLATRLPWARGALGHVELNAPVLATAAALGFFVWQEHDRQPWEAEAMYLGRTR